MKVVVVDQVEGGLMVVVVDGVEGGLTVVVVNGSPPPGVPRPFLRGFGPGTYMVPAVSQIKRRGVHINGDPERQELHGHGCFSLVDPKSTNR